MFKSLFIFSAAVLAIASAHAGVHSSDPAFNYVLELKSKIAVLKDFKSSNRTRMGVVQLDKDMESCWTRMCVENVNHELIARQRQIILLQDLLITAYEANR